MRLTSTYSVKIKNYGKIFEETLQTYRRAVSFFLSVAVAEWDRLTSLTAKSQVNAMERMTHPTASHPDTQYHFDITETSFLKFPSYLRRAAIMDALGSISSYHINQTLRIGKNLLEGKLQHCLRLLILVQLCTKIICISTQATILQKLKCGITMIGYGSLFPFVNLMSITSLIIFNLLKNVLQHCKSVASVGR